MTSEEIDKKRFDSLNFETYQHQYDYARTFWLKEIAYQLAKLSEFLQSKEEE